MLARRRALSCIAVLATIGCNLDNPGDVPPRAQLYFPNAIALSPHDPNTPAESLLVANSNFDLRYRDGSIQSYALDALEQALQDSNALNPADRPSGCESGPGPACILEPSVPIGERGTPFQSEAWIGSFSSALAMASDGSAVFIATRTDDTLSFVTRGGGGALIGCGDHACTARVSDDTSPRSKPLAWPGNPVAIVTGPMSQWADPGQTVTGEYVMVAHRSGAVSLFTYRADLGPLALTLIDVLEGLPTVLTEMAYDPSTKLVHMSIAGLTSLRVLARVGVAIPELADGADAAAAARLYDAGVIGLTGISSGNDSRDLTFIGAAPNAGAGLAQDRALVLSTEPSALLVVDVHGDGTPAGTGRVERTVAVAAGPQRMVSGVIDGRPIAVVACFDARQLYVIDLSTMLTRSVVPNLSGPFDLVLDEFRKKVYLTDFRSSVIRIVDLAPALEPGEGSGLPVRVVATLGRPQILPELQ